MADNGPVQAITTPGDDFAWDVIDDVNYPRTKLSLGADGSATDAEGGAGAVGAGVQRVTLASDDPAVATLALIKAKTDNIDVALSTRTKPADAQHVIIDSGSGGAATIADGADVTQGAVADAAVVTDTSGTLSGKLRGLVKWAFERMPTSLGQKAKAASLPVVIASDQDTLAVSAASLPLPSGAATLAEQQTQTTSLQLLDDVIKVDDAAWGSGTDKVAMIGGHVDNSLTNALDEGDSGAFRMSTARALHVTVRDSSDAAVDTFGPTQYTEGDNATGSEKVTIAGVQTSDTPPTGLTDGKLRNLYGDSRGRLHTHDTAVVEEVAGVQQSLDLLIKVEDLAHSSGDAGIQSLAVRKDTAASLATTDGDYQPLITDSSGRLHVNGSGVTQPVSAASLPLPSGASTLAEQQTQTASLSVMDDWDESDRAKVNPIVGVAGVAAGAGAVSSSVQRVTLASDDPAVSVLGATTGAAVVTDADGTIQRYLRGIVKLLITSGTIVLGAGTNAIGKLAANSGVDIGDVDVTSVAGNVTVINGGTFAVQNNGTGKTLKTASGTLTADTDVIAAVSSKRIKVYAYSIISVGTNANAAIFKSNGTSGTELWRFLIQGASGSPMGANLAVSPPGFLFATTAGEKLTLDVGNSDTIHYSIAYWDDDAT